MSKTVVVAMIFTVTVAAGGYGVYQVGMNRGMQMSAPAGNANRKIGRLSAVCNSATTSGDGVCEVISHASPTSSIQEPMLDTTEAIHNQRKSD